MSICLYDAPSGSKAAAASSGSATAGSSVADAGDRLDLPAPNSSASGSSLEPNSSMHSEPAKPWFHDAVMLAEDTYQLSDGIFFFLILACIYLLTNFLTPNNFWAVFDLNLFFVFSPSDGRVDDLVVQPGCGIRTFIQRRGHLSTYLVCPIYFPVDCCCCCSCCSCSLMIDISRERLCHFQKEMLASSSAALFKLADGK